MRRFKHINARTIDEAVSALRRYGNKANIIAGGTDLLGKMKDEVFPRYPEAVINIKTIPGLDFIKEERGILRIGGLTRLEDIGKEPTIKRKYTALAQAANRTGSPHLREMGTLGGNICQDINISIIILILIGGYLLWSIYSHVSLKKPDINAPPSKEAISLLPSRPTTSTKSMTPPMEPKIVTSEELEKETAVFPSAPAVPTTLKTSVSDRKEIENITNLFENIRQANLKKNIDLFMSCYSAGFKDQEGKKRETLKNWENFTYINLSYNLKEHTISGDTAGIRVEWVIHFYHKESNQPQESKTVLDVTLNREPDGWKIKNIKAIS
jgi:hypothetical protein